MSENKLLESRRDIAVAEIRDRLISDGTNPGVAAEQAEAVRGLIYIGDEGSFRITSTEEITDAKRGDYVVYRGTK